MSRGYSLKLPTCQKNCLIPGRFFPGTGIAFTQIEPNGQLILEKDRTGKIVIQPRFDWAGSFSENVAPVLLDAKCAHVDKSGKVLDQSQTVLPHDKWKQDRHGTYLFKPHSPPCS